MPSISTLRRRRKEYVDRRDKRRASREHHEQLARKFDKLAKKQTANIHRVDAKIKAGTHKSKGPEAALAEARKFLGKTESPYGSNLAPWGLSKWIYDRLGIRTGVAWCGISLGHWLEVAGVKGLTAHVASVYYIYSDAKAGINGFSHLVGTRDGQPGDAVGLFSLSTHVEIIEKRVPGGYQTIGGNTSSGNSGSQSNGGGVYRRIRPYSNVVYVARPKY